VSIQPDQTLLHYRVTEKLGEGGMGEVWKAVDTNLDRQVAIKVLPESLSDDLERLDRFEREAKVLASLSHPNIAAVYGMHETRGVRFIAMELVAGEDLAARLARGPLALDDALAATRRIARALEAAHDNGVVHRDLKPANILRTPAGAIKVLDFGLAKAFEPASPGTDSASIAPTMTSAGTAAGIILGTAAYMSPEQARAKPVDRRTDIWALGCVLYEMLTGSRPFDGDTVTDVIAAVVTREPDWERLPAEVPARVRRVLARCLHKDPARRFQHAGDLRIELEDDAYLDSRRAATTGDRARTKRSPVTRALALIAALALGAVATWLLRPAPGGTSPRPLRLSLDLEHTLDDSGIARRKFALSRDGRRMVFCAKTPDGPELFLRALDGDASAPIPGTLDSHTPFFSPDGESIGFFQDGQLKKMDLAAGGAPLPLHGAAGVVYGASWGDDDTILFATNTASPMRISAETGEELPFRIADSEEGFFGYFWPHYLPGARDLLFTYVGEIDGRPGPHVVSVAVGSGERRTLLQGVDARYLESGHLLFHRDNALLAAPFDPATVQLTGSAFAIQPRVAVDNFGALTAAVSDDGMLVYEPAEATRGSHLVWVDRSGKTTPVTAERRAYGIPRLSGDGAMVVWGGLVADISGDIWALDLKRDSVTRLTYEAINAYPALTRDGRRVAFTSNRGGNKYSVYVKGVLDDRPPEMVSEGAPNVTAVPTSFSPDGTRLLLYLVHPETQRDIWLLDENGEHVPLLVTPYNERAPRFSPDGRWFAYISDENDVDEIYVRRFPDTGTRWKVSVDGGREPAWNPRGGELFYRNGAKMMSVTIRESGDGEDLAIGRPVELFSGAFAHDGFGNADYDVSPDGQRFIMVQSPPEAVARLGVILDWFESLR